MSVVRRPVGPTPCERAGARLATAGLPELPRPEFEQPRMPRDITDLGDKDLIGLLIEFEAWSSYASVNAASAMAQEREAEQRRGLEEAKALVRDWGGSPKDRVTVAKAERLLDPLVQRALDDYLEIYAYRKIAEALANALERKAGAVSRELTRRTAGNRHQA